MLTRNSHLYADLLLIAFLIVPCFAIAKPVITSISGHLTPNSEIIINGSGFTTKANPEPLLWWKADFGETPSALGRVTSWHNNFNGNFSTAIVAPGSQKSAGIDFHTNSGASIAGVKFNSDRLYLHRKTYEDFDITKDQGIKPNTSPPLKTFNFKTVRLWGPKKASDGKGPNDTYIGAQGVEGPEFRISPEQTDGTTWPAQFTIRRLRQIPRAWKAEELEYKTSGINVKDGIFQFYQNGQLGTDNKFRNRTTKFPDRYSLIYQTQVSNGAAPGSIMYFDSIYLDDTWHRVVICPSKTWTDCRQREVQIPTSWNNTQIKVQLNQGGFDITKSSLYIYVVDKDGIANTNGYPLCPKCPLPPTQL